MEDTFEIIEEFSNLFILLASELVGLHLVELFLKKLFPEGELFLDAGKIVLPKNDTSEKVKVFVLNFSQKITFDFGFTFTDYIMRNIHNILVKKYSGNDAALAVIFDLVPRGFFEEERKKLQSLEN